MDLATADGLAPRDRRRQGPYWRGRFIDALIAVGQLQEKLARTERELAAVKADRDHILRRTVSLTVAEEARRRAATAMRERAATAMEYPKGMPNASSEFIRELPDPRPKWIKQ
jgi:hypothetical protein